MNVETAEIRAQGAEPTLLVLMTMPMPPLRSLARPEALLKYHKLASTKRRIPLVHIRTLSNWLHQPVKQVSCRPQQDCRALGFDLCLCDG
jgi:hypothetical protein